MALQGDGIGVQWGRGEGGNDAFYSCIWVRTKNFEPRNILRLLSKKWGTHAPSIYGTARGCERSAMGGGGGGGREGCILQLNRMKWLTLTFSGVPFFSGIHIVRLTVDTKDSILFLILSNGAGV